MLQPRFALSLCRMAHAHGLTTVLDTAAAGTIEQWDRLLPHVDAVLLCVKSSDPAKYRTITRSHDERPYRIMISFLEATRRHGVKTWIRFVLMSVAEAEDGTNTVSDAFAELATDGEDEVKGVAAIAKRYSNVAGVEVLPYHKFGEYKWHEMGLRYPLEGMKPPTFATIARVKEMFEAEGVRVIV